MTEENVTRSILSWLLDKGWDILDYDFPGGGTGRRFRISDEESIIPDVIAFKKGILLLFEDKSKETLSDYEKVKQMRMSSDLREQIHKVYLNKKIEKMLFGIGFAYELSNPLKRSQEYVDFVVQVRNDGCVYCNVIMGEEFECWDNNSPL